MNQHPLEIDVATLRDKLAKGDDMFVLDCREENEYEIVKLEPAVLLPMSELMARVGELEPQKDREIVVHCHHGGRSQQAAQYFLDQGFTRVANLRGGIEAWSREVDPAVPRY